MSPWRLERHLDAVLQDGHGERRARHGSQPQAEVLVHAIRIDVFHDLIELGHPRLREMAVLQADPHALVHGELDQALCLGALALSQRHLIEPLQHLHLRRELEQIRHRIRAAGQHEDERSVDAALGVARLKVERRRLDEPPAQLCRHEILHREHESIRADASSDEKFLERVQLAVERRVQRVTMCVRGLKVRPVMFDVLRERLFETLVRGQARHVDDLDPHLLGDPLGRGVGLRDVRVRRPREEETPLPRVDVAALLRDGDGEEQREHQLVRLEERAADVVVERVGEILVENLDAPVDVVVLLRFLRASDEERDEPRERVLVHGIHEGEIRDAEEEHGRARRHGAIFLSRLVDILLRRLRLRNLERNLVGRHLRLRQGVDEHLVVQYVARGVTEEVENLILNLRQFFLHAGVGYDELVLRLGEILALLHHNRAEKLILQAVEGDEEVEQRHLDAHLGLIMRVSHFGGDVEPEVRVIRDDVVAHLDHLAAALLERLLLQQRLERRVGVSPTFSSKTARPKRMPLASVRR